jgi:hypothetical protein
MRAETKQKLNTPHKLRRTMTHEGDIMTDPTASEPEHHAGAQPESDPAATEALPPAPPGPGPSPYGPPPYGPPLPYAFAAPPRAPRERWINPAKRTGFIVVSIVAALVLLFVGAVIGHAVARHQDNRFAGTVQHQTPRQFLPYGPGNRGQLPNRIGPGRPGATTVPSHTVVPAPATPSASATSS